MAHPDPRALLETDLSAGTRESLLQHIRGCRDCRATLIELEPSLLFSVLALDPVPPAMLERLSARVSSEIDRGAGPAGTGRWARRLAAVAASAVLAALAGAYVWTRQIPSPAQVAEVAGTPASRGASLETVTASRVELLAPAEAEIVNFQVGDTTFVMIFDEDLDL